MQSKSKILIVDDNPINLEIIEEILSEDFELTRAMSGEKALELAVKINPDLILLDIMMPGMNGYEVCERIRMNPNLRYIRIVMVTAKGMNDEKLKGYETGANGYIVKPFSEQELLEKVYFNLASMTKCN